MPSGRRRAAVLVSPSGDAGQGFTRLQRQQAIHLTLGLGTELSLRQSGNHLIALVAPSSCRVGRHCE